MSELETAARLALKAINEYLHCCFEKETDIKRDPFSKSLDDCRIALRNALAKPVLGRVGFCPICNQRDAVRAKFDEESG